MKKTVTINVHGSMFHIDEDAYFMLQEYLHTLEKHFNVDDSAHEIMSDIEARISELIQMKIKRPEQVVTISDVQEIIKIMGTPEDFGIHTDTSTSSSKFDENQKFKRLYRDDDGRILGGGVCWYGVLFCRRCCSYSNFIYSFVFYCRTAFVFGSMDYNS